VPFFPYDLPFCLKERSVMSNHGQSRRRFLTTCAALGLAGWHLGRAAAGDDKGQEVTLKDVKYPDLVAALKAQRDRVVVLDVWATYCVPCKKEFPHLVELHHQYVKDGLTCISVSVDETDQREAALKFLKAQKATFPNFLLNEEAAVWQEKWDLKSIPAVFVFGRDGKVAARFDNDDEAKPPFTYEEVEKKVKELLAVKPAKP